MTKAEERQKNSMLLKKT